MTWSGLAARVRWGPVLMLLAALAFTTMVACVKVARAELSTFEVVWWRGVVSVPLCALWLGRGPWRLQARRLFAVRVLFGFTAMAGYYAAAGGLAVANLTLIGRLQPIVVAVIAPLLLGSAEQVDRRTWLLTALGVLGCSVLLAPELDSGNPAGLLALLAVVASAIAHTTLRRLGTTDHPRTIVFWFQLCVTALALAWASRTSRAFARASAASAASASALARRSAFSFSLAFAAAARPRVPAYSRASSFAAAAAAPGAPAAASAAAACCSSLSASLAALASVAARLASAISASRRTARASATVALADSSRTRLAARSASNAARSSSDIAAHRSASA